MLYPLLTHDVTYRFTVTEDFDWFTKTLTRVAVEGFGEEVSRFLESSGYFVDFLR